MKSMNIEEVKVNQIEVGERFRKDYGDLLPLQVSIETLGLLQPIGITVGMQLVYGGRRLQAFKNLKRKTIPCVVVDFDNLLLAENDENDDEIRKSFTPSEKLAIARKLEEMIGDRQGQRTDKSTSRRKTRSSEEPEKGQKTKDHVAKVAGLGGESTMRQMEKV